MINVEILKKELLKQDSVESCFNDEYREMMACIAGAVDCSIEKIERFLTDYGRLTRINQMTYVSRDMPNLYQWPFANVSGAGGVCYGSNNIRKIERLSDLDILPILFFDSPMNSDYYTPHRTTLGKATIRELLDTLNGKKEFPYEILQEYNPLTYKRSIF